MTLRKLAYSIRTAAQSLEAVLGDNKIDKRQRGTRYWFFVWHQYLQMVPPEEVDSWRTTAVIAARTHLLDKLEEGGYHRTGDLRALYRQDLDRLGKIGGNSAV